MKNWRTRFRICEPEDRPQQKDFAYRLCMLSAQQLGAGDQGLNCGGTGIAPPPVGATAQGPATMAPGTPLPPINSDQAAAALLHHRTMRPAPHSSWAR